MPNLEILNLSTCINLEEVDDSLEYCGKLIELNLCSCERLKRSPSVKLESLEFLNVSDCSSLEKFPEILGRMKPELEIHKTWLGIRELPSSIILHQAPLTKLILCGMKNLVALPNSIGMFRGLVKLNVSYCFKLESLPEEIGDLENLEKLKARATLISQPPSSIVRLNKLKFLSFASQSSELHFVFPQVNEGLRSLEILDFSECIIIDGGLPDDIGCLYSLKELDFSANKFEHLPRSIAQLSSLRSLDLKDCYWLRQLPEFPEQLDKIDVDCRSDWICNLLFQNISSLQHDISASDSLSHRVFTSWCYSIPSWFRSRGTGTMVSVNLLENWYVSDNFLGFAVCYSGKLIDNTAQLIPLCDDGMSSMNQKLALSNHSKKSSISTINFFRDTLFWIVGSS
ncbi:TMV resistance protein N [Capsicum annuum]|nr:TMV resistance protein N [Capsicum annuum]KAF3667868.1 TMV resistance protein N [Capsicum annuum]